MMLYLLCLLCIFGDVSPVLFALMLLLYLGKIHYMWSGGSESLGVSIPPFFAVDSTAHILLHCFLPLVSAL